MRRHEASGDGLVEAIKFRQFFFDEDRRLNRFRLGRLHDGRRRYDNDGWRFDFRRHNDDWGRLNDLSFFGDGSGALVHFRQALLEEIGRNQSEEGEEDPEKWIRQEAAFLGLLGGESTCAWARRLAFGGRNCHTWPTF